MELGRIHNSGDVENLSKESKPGKKGGARDNVLAGAVNELGDKVLKENKNSGEKSWAKLKQKLKPVDRLRGDKSNNSGKTFRDPSSQSSQSVFDVVRKILEENKKLDPGDKKGDTIKYEPSYSRSFLNDPLFESPSEPATSGMANMSNSDISMVKAYLNENRKKLSEGADLKDMTKKEKRELVESDAARILLLSFETGVTIPKDISEKVGEVDRLHRKLLEKRAQKDSTNIESTLKSLSRSVEVVRGYFGCDKDL